MNQLERQPQKEILQPYERVAIIGAGGQVGGMMLERLQPSPSRTIYPVGHGDGDIKEVMEHKPDFVIMATPNPVTDAVKEVCTYARDHLTIVLVQNGLGVVEQTQRVDQKGINEEAVYICFILIKSLKNQFF